MNRQQIFEKNAKLTSNTKQSEQTTVQNKVVWRRVTKTMATGTSNTCYRNLSLVPMTLIATQLVPSL